MAKKVVRGPEDYINSLYINGLEGRVLNAPTVSKTEAGKKREILLLYGHHALLERWWGLAQTLQHYGSVTIPDLPGLGGMDSFAKIGLPPTLDNYADYLAAFIKLNYKKRRFTIMGVSFGFIVATRMLQKYPDIAKRIDLVVSFMGFTHANDFHWSSRKRNTFRIFTRTFATRPVAFFIRYACLNRWVIRNIYTRTPGGKRRFMTTPLEEFERMMDFETRLWQVNDVRTHWLTTTEFLNLQNDWTKVDLPLYHVASSSDHFFDNNVVEQHMRVIFKSYQQGVMETFAHTPSVLGDKKAMSIMVPQSLKRLLRKG